MRWAMGRGVWVLSGNARVCWGFVGLCPWRPMETCGDLWRPMETYGN